MNVTNEASEEQSKPTLEFDHNVIEHLGIKLYQNKPANVLAELVSNSWDADSRTVWVESYDNHGQLTITVADDGSGMDIGDIRSRYLVIGKQKRKTSAERSAILKRLPMGRKGIGKLAPFGIARQIDVISLKNGELNWFTLELDGLKGVASRKRYEPKFTIYRGNTTNLPESAPDNIKNIVQGFLDRVTSAEQGTAIIMSNLTLNSPPDRIDIVAKLASRFTVILSRPDFIVNVNGTPIEEAEAMPDFDLRIPDSSQPYATETVGGREVRYWAGFYRTAERATDEAGVGVYTHGKIAQDRPFFFNSTGKEVFQRYLYAVVEADWLDDTDEDLVSTDRTSVNWSHPLVEELAKWGKIKVGEWLNAYDRHRKGKSEKETRDLATRLRSERKILSFSRSENEAVDKLVAEATGGISKSQVEKAREDLLEAITKAWANQPTRELVKEIWDRLPKHAESAEAFEHTIRALYDNSVPEAMGLALTFAQRAYALTVLTKLVHERSETNLQELIEEFPWIVDPNGSVLTADQTMKTTINKLADEYSGDNRYDPLYLIKSIDAKTRADFVFLSDADKGHIKIIELKAPSGDTLQRYHETQLVSYIDQISNTYNHAIVEGMLIGNRGAGNAFQAQNVCVTVKGWDQVLLECRAIYIDLLAAMMTKADIDSTDDRIGMIKDFAGPEVWDALKRIALKDEHLASVMDKLAHLATPPTPPPSEAPR